MEDGRKVFFCVLRNGKIVTRALGTGMKQLFIEFSIFRGRREKKFSFFNCISRFLLREKGNFSFSSEERGEEKSFDCIPESGEKGKNY
jgi:hypothetical protein